MPRCRRSSALRRPRGSRRRSASAFRPRSSSASRSSTNRCPPRGVHRSLEDHIQHLCVGALNLCDLTRQPPVGELDHRCLVGVIEGYHHVAAASEILYQSRVLLASLAAPAREQHHGPAPSGASARRAAARPLASARGLSPGPLTRGRRWSGCGEALLERLGNRRREPAPACVALCVPRRVRDCGHQLPRAVRLPLIRPLVVYQVQRRATDLVLSGPLAQRARELLRWWRRRPGARLRSREQHCEHESESDQRQPAAAEARAVEERHVKERHPAPPQGSSHCIKRPRGPRSPSGRDR